MKILILDTETTGLDPEKDDVIEVSYENRHEAKSAGFHWNGSSKLWEKTVRMCGAAPLNFLPFDVEILPC